MKTRSADPSGAFECVWRARGNTHVICACGRTHRPRPRPVSHPPCPCPCPCPWGGLQLWLHWALLDTTVVTQKRTERRQERTRSRRFSPTPTSFDPPTQRKIRTPISDANKQRCRRPSGGVLNVASRRLTVRRLRDNWGENWAFTAGDRKWNALKVKAWAAMEGGGGVNRPRGTQTFPGVGK